MITRVSFADVAFSNMEEMFWGQSLCRQLFPEVLLQRSAEILKVACLHCKNLDEIENMKEKKKSLVILQSGNDHN